MFVKKIIIALLLLMAVTNVQAFDYHGIKSGMSRSQVDALVDCKEYCSGWDYKQLETFFGKDKEPPALWEMYFSYTSDDKLWKIHLKFLDSGGPYGAAQTRILSELYDDAELQKSSSSSSYGTTDYVNALIIDEALFDADVKKIYEETKSKY